MLLRLSPIRTSCLACAALAMLASPDLASAQTAPSPAAPPATAAAASTGQPPVIRFDRAGIPVDEAVRLALENSPQIGLSRQNLRRQEGAVQEQQGYFDYSLLANLSYEYRVQELAESKQEEEINTREDTRADIDDNKELSAQTARLLGRLRAVQQMPDDPERLRELTKLAPELGLQLEILSQLIADASSAGVRSSLDQIRSELITATLDANGEDLNEILRSIATQEEDLRKLGAAPIDEVFKNGRVNVQLSKLFRTGIVFAPYADGSLEASNYKDKERAEEFGGKGFQDLYTFHAGASLIFPLLRGRGRDATGAFERAAILGRSAAQADLDHEMSASALDTVLAYWEARAAQDALAIAEQSLAQQTQVADLTKTLIDAGELPGVEGSRSQAALARSQTRVADARRRVLEARAGLASAMGVAATEEDATLPRAATPFPQVQAAPLAAPEVVTLTQAALGGERKDVIAAARREDAAGTMERFAETNLRPVLDLTVKSFFTALGEQSATNSLDRFVGPSTSVTLAFEKPLGNNTAEGQLVQRRAERQIERITSADLQRQIRLGVLRTAGSLPDAIERVRQAEAATAAFDKTVEGELERFRVSESTLLDTIITEQQRTESQVALVEARRSLAELIALLRYETGTLVVNGALAPQTVPGR